MHSHNYHALPWQTLLVQCYRSRQFTLLIMAFLGHLQEATLIFSFLFISINTQTFKGVKLCLFADSIL